MWCACDMFDFIGSGALNLDLIYEIDDISTLKRYGLEFVPGHETIGSRGELSMVLSVLAGEARLVSKCGGGSAANTTVCLASLGHKTAFVGVAGDDAEGEQILTSMCDVDVSGVKKAGSSGVCIVVIDKTLKDRAMCVFPPQIDENVWNTLNLPPSKCIHFSSLALNNAPDIQLKLLVSTSKESVFSFDPGEVYGSKGLDFISGILNQTDILFLTESELKMLFGAGSEQTGHLVSRLFKFLRQNKVLLGKTSSSSLHRTMPPVLVLKQGKSGVKVFSGPDFKDSFHISAIEVKDVVDTTGAGDAFDAGFLSGLSQGKTLSEASKDGVILAARSITSYGRGFLT